MAYPLLAAQTLAITGSAGITRAATATTLARVWRSWPSLRQAPDLLVRARWTAVLIAAERESTAPSLSADAVQASIGELTGADELDDARGDIADTVVVTAMQRLPRVQRRALVLHYMGGVSVVDMAALSGSSAEHIELLLDDGFTALAESLVWSRRDAGINGPDLRFDLAAEVLADTAARLPERIAAPPSSALLRFATVAQWSVRVVPVAVGAACAAVIAAIVQPASPELRVPATIYAEHGGDTVDAPVGGPSGDTARPDVVPGTTAATQPGPMIRMRSVALTALLDAADRRNTAHDGGADAHDDAPTRRSQPESPAVSTVPSSGSSGATVNPSATGPAGPSAGEPSGGRPGASTSRPVAAPPDRSSAKADPSSPTPRRPTVRVAGTLANPAADTPTVPAVGALANPAADTPTVPGAGALANPAAGTQASGPTPLVGPSLATDAPAALLTTADPPTTDPRPTSPAADPPTTYDSPTVERKSASEPKTPTSRKRAAVHDRDAVSAEGGEKAEHRTAAKRAADD